MVKIIFCLGFLALIYKIAVIYGRVHRVDCNGKFLYIPTFFLKALTFPLFSKALHIIVEGPFFKDAYLRALNIVTFL
ncbi:hypothetical protein J2736_003573 [Paenibacillus qinlingensis]|uniref:Uncharacterized protein n=1 Tax=Paenibacillus qinlingensis TaxID=1837343 RepID=A0ABU1NZU8_9BACL|nr:hypothetical protein [Paenibacillus qinlingensis]